jgi:hypothetical protein
MSTTSSEFSEQDIEALLAEQKIKQQQLEQAAEALRQKRVAAEIASLLTVSAKHKQEEQDEQDILRELTRKRIAREAEAKVEQERIASQDAEKNRELTKAAAIEQARVDARKSQIEELKAAEEQTHRRELALQHEMESALAQSKAPEKEKPVELLDPASQHPLAVLIFGAKATEQVPAIDSREALIADRAKDKEREAYRESIRDKSEPRSLSVDLADIRSLQYTIRQLFSNENINTEQATTLLAHNYLHQVVNALQVVAAKFQTKRMSMSQVVNMTDQLASQ